MMSQAEYTSVDEALEKNSQERNLFESSGQSYISLCSRPVHSHTEIDIAMFEVPP